MNIFNLKNFTFGAEEIDNIIEAETFKQTLQAIKPTGTVYDAILDMMRSLDKDYLPSEHSHIEEEYTPSKHSHLTYELSPKEEMFYNYGWSI